MPDLILRRIRCSSPVFADLGDYSVYCDGVLVGRISEQHWMPPSGHPWHWSIHCVFRNPDYPDNSPYRWRGRADAGGTALTLDDAKAQFRAKWAVVDPDIEAWR